MRRFQELTERGEVTDYETVLREQKERDFRDENRLYLRCAGRKMPFWWIRRGLA